MDKINFTSGDLVSHYGVSAIIKNSSSEILMQDHVKYGFWTIPIGKTEELEKLEEALKKEIFEECGIIIEDFKFLYSKDYFYEREGKEIKVITQVYEILKYSGNLENKEVTKHRTQKFISLEEIKKIPYLSDSTLVYLEFLGFKREAKI
jgi:ADP-ribose pyrophosphatase YjhB (NUDIX family)